jgi:glucan phosphoethanolaminetransferase (alkaline phosphatase superfamily)
MSLGLIAIGTLNMDIKKDYGQSLLIFVLGLLSLVVADYSIRQFAGSPNNLGMPEVVWFALQVIISVVSIFVFIKNIQTLPISKKIISSLLLLLIGAVVYICVIYGYVFSTQIDGF